MVISIELPQFIRASNGRLKKIPDGGKSLLKMKLSLIERKKLHFRCCRVNDIMCIVALFGLILMIIDTEFRFKQISVTNAMIIRPSITISTIILLGLVIYYHALDIRLYAINNHIADWRVTLSVRGFLMIVAELVVCSIHPFPYIDRLSWFEGVTWLEMTLTLPSSLIFVFSSFDCVMI